MAITSLDTYIAATKQMVVQKKTASLTAVALQLTSVIHLAGLPGAGVLAGTNTASGVVPDDATAGMPVINAFTGSKGHITRINAYNTVASTLHLVDLLFKAGAYAFGASTTLVTQPDYSGRVPTGGYGNLEIWLEAVTAFTGSQSIRILYNDANGVERDTGVIATGVAPIIGRCFRMPLVAAGYGVKRINQVISSVSTVGTFNVLVVRPLARIRIPFAGYCESRDLYGTGMPEVFANSALAVYVQPDSTASGNPEFEIEVANG